MKEHIVGIVGAYGSVGRHVARLIRRWRTGRLRLGGRNLEAVHRVASEDADGEAEVQAVDAGDLSSLTRFCTGCRVVVNCAGPSWKTSDHVARAALAVGADCVETNGEEPLRRRLEDRVAPSKRGAALLSAGMLPGLSGILPRYLAAELDEPERLTAYIGVLDRLTEGAAGDYVAGLDQSASLAAWHQGERRQRSLHRLVNVEVPFFPGRVTAHPYLSFEGERLARCLRLRDAHWYNVFDGQHLVGALERLPGRTLSECEIDAAASELARAADLDVAGRTPYQLLLFQLDGRRDGQSLTRSLVLRSHDAAALTGATAAMAAEALVDGRVEPGVHFAADALDPAMMVGRLGSIPSVDSIQLMDRPLIDELSIDEGVL